MKRLDGKEEGKDRKDGRVTKKASILLFLLVLFLFVLILIVMELVEMSFGKTAGTAALIVIAAGIAVFLYKDEIKAKFKRENRGDRK